MIKARKGLSEIVAYVLLVVIAISLALLVYAWMKGLLWKPTKECPEGTSLIIIDYSCEENSKTINITFRNNGLFDVTGFIVRISNETGRLPIKPLKDGSPLDGDYRGDFFFNNALKPNEEFTNSFPYNEHSRIIEMEITPLKLFGGEMLICDKAKIKQEIEGCG